jgi:hypothetical protein
MSLAASSTSRVHVHRHDGLASDAVEAVGEQHVRHKQKSNVSPWLARERVEQDRNTNFGPMAID